MEIFSWNTEKFQSKAKCRLFLDLNFKNYEEVDH